MRAVPLQGRPSEPWQGAEAGPWGPSPFRRAPTTGPWGAVRAARDVVIVEQRACVAGCATREPTVRAVDPAWHRVPEPRVGLADVPVLLRRRPAVRLAPGPPRLLRARWCRAGHGRGDGRRARGADLSSGRRHLERRTGGGLPADH